MDYRALGSGAVDNSYGPVRFEAGAGGRTWWRHSALPVGVGLLVAIGWGVLKMQEDRAAATFAIGLTIVVVSGLFFFTLWANARSWVVVTDTHVLVGTPWGMRAIERHTIAAALAPHRMTVRGAPGEHLFLLGHDGTRLAQVIGTNWEPGLMGHVAAAITPVVHRPASLTPAEARRQFPGVLPWSWQHPNLAMLVGMVGTLVAIGLLVLIAWLAVGR